MASSNEDCYVDVPNHEAYMHVTEWAGSIGVINCGYRQECDKHRWNSHRISDMMSYDAKTNMMGFGLVYREDDPDRPKTMSLGEWKLKVAIGAKRYKARKLSNDL